MKILVCIKQVCHVYVRTGMDPALHFIAPEDQVYRVNPYDESALGLALKLKAVHGGTEVVLLTLGRLTAERELRRCLALGGDELYRIDVEDGMDPWSKSRLLARAAKDMAAGVVLCGKESLDRQDGQVGAFMAHHLGLPFVSEVTEMTIDRKCRVARAGRHAGRGVREVVECPLPAVFSVGLGSHETRLPTYEDTKLALAAPIKRLDYGEEDAKPHTVTRRVFPPRPRPKDVFAPDGRLEAFDRIKQLLAGSRIEKKGAILSGHPESQV
ncbi:MAG: electron transfer flavoprotein subunit beta/FixA family protein, partial [Desulfatiglandales bacterium]